jgi:hypothetical protein
MIIKGVKDLVQYFLSTKIESIQINKPNNRNIVIYIDAAFRNGIYNSSQE